MYMLMYIIFLAKEGTSGSVVRFPDAQKDHSHQTLAREHPKKKKKVDTVMSCGIGIGRETIRMNTPICWASQAARWRYEAATAISKNEEGQDLEESTLWHPGMDTLHLSVLFSSFCLV